MAYVNTFERIALRQKYEKGLEKGLQRGKHLGVNQGKVEGKIEGKIEALQGAVLRTLQSRTSLSSDEMNQIKNCQNLEILDKAFTLSLDGVSKEEVLALLPLPTSPTQSG